MQTEYFEPPSKKSEFKKALAAANEDLTRMRNELTHAQKSKYTP